MVIKVFTGTKGRKRFSAPIPDAIFFVISFICVVHERFSSTYTPRDLAWETCLIGVPLIVKFGADWKVRNLCLDPMSMVVANRRFFKFTILIYNYIST